MGLTFVSKKRSWAGEGLASCAPAGPAEPGQPASRTATRVDSTREPGMKTSSATGSSPHRGPTRAGLAVAQHGRPLAEHLDQHFLVRLGERAGLDDLQRLLDGVLDPLQLHAVVL